MKGSGKDQDLSETLHTAVAVTAWAGILLMALGMACTEVLLRAVGTPKDVFTGARQYLMIYFVRMRTAGCVDLQRISVGSHNSGAVYGVAGDKRGGIRNGNCILPLGQEEK